MKIKFKTISVWKPGTVSNALIGRKVRPGPDWDWGNQNNGQYGTIFDLPTLSQWPEHKQKNYYWVTVLWDEYEGQSYKNDYIVSETYHNLEILCI